MSRFTKQITSYWQQFRTVVRNEYGSIFTDAGVILVLVLALLIYSTLYSLAYGTQVLRNVPIGVIDMSNTSTSRQLINTFNAGPNVYVAYIIGKTKCDGIQNQMRLFGGRVSPKRKATKISHTHTKKHRSNGF